MRQGSRTHEVLFAESDGNNAEFGGGTRSSVLATPSGGIGNGSIRGFGVRS